MNSIRLQIGNALADLPNTKDFRFRGVLEDGDLIPCVVARTDSGIHFAVEETTRKPCYYYLRGWMPYQQDDAK